MAILQQKYDYIFLANISPAFSSRVRCGAWLFADTVYICVWNLHAPLFKIRFYLSASLTAFASVRVFVQV